nr:HAD family phosphatase [Actinotalea ferrariae]
MPPSDASLPHAVNRPADSPLPAAVLWDMDGTLVDTEPAWMAAEVALVAEFGGVWTDEDSLRMIGMPLLTAAGILRAHGVDLPEDAIVERLVASVVAAVGRDLVWQPGARELLGAVRDAGIPCALVTMSYRNLAEAVVGQAPPGTFDLLVTGDEVTHGKPHPEPYLRAADLLGVDITRCVAVEDSPPGVASALASGARTLGVQHIARVEAQPGLSRAGSLAQIGLDDLRALVRGDVLDLLEDPAA